MDKILTEAFDKLKAIEESDDPFCLEDKDEPIEEADDPFCIGQLSENEDDRSVTCSNCGAINDTDDMRGDTSCNTCGKDVYAGQEGGRGEMDEAEHGEDPEGDDMAYDYGEDKSYEVEDNSGNHYGVYFQGEGRGDPHVFIEANGITVAHFAVGGAGPMNAKVVKPEELLDAIVAFATQGR